MSKALYRKYRPCCVEDVIGQPQVTEPLTEVLKSGNFSHAYLFCGPRGCGKTSVARIFAHAVNNFKYELEDEYIDIIEIDAASNTGVDNIRELRDKATIVPSEGKYKVYIIDEVHMLSKSAFNALLKTLEEPPEHVIFIMATTDPEKIPPTILSRTQTFHFKLVDPAIMQAHLAKIATAENINIAEDALKIIVRRGGGSFRDSLSLLDQISTLSADKSSPITAEKVNTVLGLPSDAIIDGLLSAYSAGDLAAASAHLKSFYNIGGKPEALTNDLIARILDNPNPAHLGLLAKLPDVKEPYAEARLLLCFVKTSGVVMQPQGVVPRLRRADGLAAISETNNRFGRSEAYIPDATDKAAKQSLPASQRMTPKAFKSSEEIASSRPNIFSYDAFAAALKSTSPALANALTRCTYDFDGSTLTIFAKGFVKKTLEKDSNAKILIDCAGVAIKISSDQQQKDPTISQISDIMGDVQEVNNGGETPFN